MDILPVVGVITVAAIVARFWRIRSIVPLRDLAMVARATRSPRACVAFLLFCR